MHPRSRRRCPRRTRFEEARGWSRSWSSILGSRFGIRFGSPCRFGFSHHRRGQIRLPRGRDWALYQCSRPRGNCHPRRDLPHCYQGGLYSFGQENPQSCLWNSWGSCSCWGGRCCFRCLKIGNLCNKGWLNDLWNIFCVLGQDLTASDLRVSHSLNRLPRCLVVHFEVLEYVVGSVFFFSPSSRSFEVMTSFKNKKASLGYLHKDTFWREKFRFYNKLFIGFLNTVLRFFSPFQLILAVKMQIRIEFIKDAIK